jgi:mono/diheme cytochrome c family protein
MWRTQWLGLSVGIAVAVGASGWAAAPSAPSTPVKRGEYLVNIMGCHECHSPLKHADGQDPDPARLLSGHPEAAPLLSPPTLPDGPWQLVGTGTMTAWAGPWAVSYAANITSDKETGIGGWSEAQFIQAIRTGKHWGQGRPLLGPMPWRWLSKANDEDLKAIFAYLQSTRPIRNAVPSPQAR